MKQSQQKQKNVIFRVIWKNERKNESAASSNTDGTSDANEWQIAYEQKKTQSLIGKRESSKKKAESGFIIIFNGICPVLCLWFF